MNLYKLTQDVNSGWDTFDSAIVCTESIQDAIRIHPSSFDGECVEWDDRDEYFRVDTLYWANSWVPHIKDVNVELIGVATPDIKKGVVLASFNAG